MKSAIFRIEARADALEAYHWYHTKDFELAQRFKAELDRVVGLVRQRPLAYPVLLRGARKAFVINPTPVAKVIPMGSDSCVRPRRAVIQSAPADAATRRAPEASRIALEGQANGEPLVVVRHAPEREPERGRRPQQQRPKTFAVARGARSGDCHRAHRSRAGADPAVSSFPLASHRL
jgi:hypothetical protein